MSMSRGSISHQYEYVSTYSIGTMKNRFTLNIRQQPIQSRISTTNEKDRRPLDPPPIVQIELTNATSQETQDFLQNPYLFMSITLVHSYNYEDIGYNLLSGQTSSSMYKLKDINNQDGGFFVFGDISVRSEGQFRLKFSLFEISEKGVHNMKSVYSDVFQVYTSKSFPGILESTFLSRSFSDQGVRIRIRKEHRIQIIGARKRKLSTHEELMPNKIKYHPEYWSQPRFNNLPFSPPPQPYDLNARSQCYKNIPIHNILPSPPAFKYEQRQMSSDDPLRPMKSTPHEIIHLPPLRSIMSLPQDLGEVDAAVAMMQLASRSEY
ncbi:velvet factor-domain-containing protein [Pilobolus umbonatus]|nr:velvet factor-domain-containing protein [Pilobolus umbonatus]